MISSASHRAPVMGQVCRGTITHRHGKTAMNAGFVTTVTVVTMGCLLSYGEPLLPRFPALSCFTPIPIKGENSAVTIVTVCHAGGKITMNKALVV